MSKVNEDVKSQDDWVQPLADNLNRNVMLKHIDLVDHGVLPIDDDYRKEKARLIKLWGKEKYEAESLKRESMVEESYGTDWKSKRISSE